MCIRDSNSPHARRGRRIRDGLRPLPPTPIKTNLATQLSLMLRDPAALLVRSPGKPTQLSSPLRKSRGASLVRSPGKPCHTTFITVAALRGASRTLWSQYPRAPTTGLLKNPSSCTAPREPGREPSRGTNQDSAPSRTQPPHFTQSFP